MPSKQFIRSYFKAFTQDPVQKCFTSESMDSESKTLETTETQSDLNSNAPEDQSQEASVQTQIEVNHIPPADR